MKLTFLEWTNLILAVVQSLGEDTVTGVMRRALGEERADLLIRDKKGPALSKDDNRAIVRELYEVCPGQTREEKIGWAIAIAQPAFETRERFMEVVRFVRGRVEADEAAGGTMDNPPPKPVAPSEPVDLAAATWWAKRGEVGASWPIVGAVRIDPAASTFDIHPEPPLSGPNLVVAYFVERNGEWIGGGFDGCGKAPFTRKRKTWNNVRSGLPGRYGPNREEANRAVVRPKSGEMIAMCLLSVGRRERTASVLVRYP